jgi:hypothetical protein
MRPLTPLLSPPALPMKTRPFQAIAGLRLVGEDATVAAAAEYAAVEPGDAAIDLEHAGFERFVRTPDFLAGVRIDREGVLLGGTEQQTVDLDEAGLEAGLLAGVVFAQHLQLADVLGVDRIERDVALRGQRAVVARPVDRRREAAARMDGESAQNESRNGSALHAELLARGRFGSDDRAAPRGLPSTSSKRASDATPRVIIAHAA